MNANDTTTNNLTTLPSTPKPQTSKEIIAANVQLLIEQLEAGHSEALTAYLTAMGRFHNYSLGNILEIARQMPDATRVAGLYAWNQLGRKVMKGQKGTFTDDLAEEIADENEKRSTEEVLLSVIDGTADSKLTAFALRLALSGHRGIPRDGQPDFLAEADAVFAHQEKKAKTQKAPKAKNGPVAVPSPKAQPKKKTAKKQIAA